jgi:MoaA/NifB/PqqE/SkfB family radical SAM enzyme
MYLPTVKPDFDAPMESWTPKLIEQGIGGHPYNMVFYGDCYWAVHWMEGKFDADAFFAGKALRPVLVGETKEEICYGLERLHENGGTVSGRVAANIILEKPQNTSNAPRNTLKLLAKKIGRILGEKAIALDTNGDSDGICFQQYANNLLYIKDSYRRKLVEVLPDSPGLKNSVLPQNNLFEKGDGLPIIILSPAPSRTCNYRCEYCFNHDHGFTKNDRAMDSWSKAVLTAVEKIPRPLHMSMGAMGEPLGMKKWLSTAIKVLEYSHVKRVAFVSNLSVDPAKVIPNLDPSRIGVLATLHPSEFKDYEKELAVFLDRVAYLKSSGVSIAVNYVLIPDQLERFRFYREILQSIGVPMICNMLRGPFRGKVYPEAYSPEEYALAKSCHDKTPFVFDFQSHEKNPYGIRCVSGRWGFQLEFDGTVYNCDFARQRLGSIFDSKLMVRSENCFCTAIKCESQVMIGMIEDVATNYKMEGNMHYFTKRSEKGANPLL